MGKGMRCKRGDLCPCKSAVNRKDAVRAVCEKLKELIQQDTSLLHQITCGAREIDAHGDEQLQSEIAALRVKIQARANKINDLEELSGQGSEEDRRRRKAMINAATTDRATLQLELTRREKTLGCGAAAITPEQITEILRGFATLLEEAANGNLGEDVVYKAFRIFRQLTGGRIWVHVEQRAGRKRTNVRGAFTPQLLQAVKSAVEVPRPADGHFSEDVSVWLRKPPKVNALAERVHQLVDIDGLSLRDAAKVLQEEGHKVNSGNVWYMYRRWYEMRGLPVSKLPYNNGRQRKSR